MSSFAGLSVVTGRKGDCTMLHMGTDTDSGYHLLVVNDYSRSVQEVSNGQQISSVHCFMVGGYQWFINYYPNGCDPSCADYISLSLGFLQDQDYKQPAEVKYQFSFDDQVEYHNPMHICATKTYSFSIDEFYQSCKRFIRRDALERSTHLKADSFTIRCDIIICKDPSTQDVSATMPDIGQHLDYLLQNKVGADVTFEVNGEMFAAHRCVLAARSKVFMALLFGPMVEGTTSSVIHIKDMEAKLFAALLKFIYTDSFPKMDKGNYMEEEQGKDEEDGQVMWLQWLQDLLVAADRYDLQRLKFLCGKQLSEHIGVSSAASTLALAEQHHCQGLKEACFKFIQVQCPKCLDKLMATDGWEHMSTTYPSLLKEFIAKLVSNQKDKKRKRQRMQCGCNGCK